MERENFLEERKELALLGLSNLQHSTEPFFVACIDFIKKVEAYDLALECKENIPACLEALYEDIRDRYEVSFANPTYATSIYGLEVGKALSYFWRILRELILAVVEKDKEKYVSLQELLLELHFHYTQSGFEAKTIRDMIYWYKWDYALEHTKKRFEKSWVPYHGKAYEVLSQEEINLEDLYTYGLYVGINEVGTFKYLSKLSEEHIAQMAKLGVDGYVKGFENTGRDLSKKSSVDLYYPIGFERLIKSTVRQLKDYDLDSILYPLTSKANPQYDYDHGEDEALILDSDYLNRFYQVEEQCFLSFREECEAYGGPLVIETFGENPFSPVEKEETSKFNSKQKKLRAKHKMKLSQLEDRFSKEEETSYALIAWPLPEIGKDYEAIFEDIYKVNSLNSKDYLTYQDRIIDVLDKGKYLYIKGKGDNQTDLKIRLNDLEDPKTQTNFENCVADVNIPVGEVFTTPVLEGTQGILDVSKVYLNGFEFRNLRFEIEEGRVVRYTCSNFDNEEDNRQYIQRHILFYHENLPMGECAIGTNTLAYVIGLEYGIFDKLPILIAEKTGPHLAFGDSCYSWAEDVKVYNPNGKEIVARDNSLSIMRKEDVSKAYVNCHTDITIPYDEIEAIYIVDKDNQKHKIIENGYFVVEGTEALNEPLIKYKKEKKDDQN